MTKERRRPQEPSRALLNNQTDVFYVMSVYEFVGLRGRVGYQERFLARSGRTMDGESGVGGVRAAEGMRGRNKKKKKKKKGDD